jgi:hypothetical protein
MRPDADEMFQDNAAITGALGASVQSKIAFGPRAGQYVRKIGKGFGYKEEMHRAERASAAHGSGTLSPDGPRREVRGAAPIPLTMVGMAKVGEGACRVCPEFSRAAPRPALTCHLLPAPPRSAVRRLTPRLAPHPTI